MSRGFRIFVCERGVEGVYFKAESPAAEVDPLFKIGPRTIAM